MFQQMIIQGNLGKDPESGTSKAGKAYARYTVAVERPIWDGDKKEMKYDTQWFNCVAFDKRAEYIIKNAKKGNPVIVTGKMYSNKHEGKEYWSLETDSIKLLPYGNRAKNNDNSGTTNTASAGSTGAVGAALTDDEIPF